MILYSCKTFLLSCDSIEEGSALFRGQAFRCYQFIGYFEVLEVSKVAILPMESPWLSGYIVSVFSLASTLVVIPLLWRKKRLAIVRWIGRLVFFHD